MKKLAVAAVLLPSALLCAGAEAEVRIRDNFEYTVTRDQTGKPAAFAANGGWDYVKSRPDASGACGYIYTTNAIPGYTGAFPGTGSSRVLAMEFLPRSLNCLVGDNWYQTDAYLQKGGTNAPQNTIPSNAWYQFWIYINNYGSQQTRWEGTKWLYPCIDGQGTCSSNNVSFLHILTTNSMNPYLRSSSGADAYARFEGNYAMYAPGHPEPGGWKLGHNVAPGQGLLRANQWILVKINVDLSGSQGVYREWHKTVGGSFVPVANWVGGVTPGFTWPLAGLNPARLIGQKSMKVGTTWNQTDGWIYLDDFVIASGESDLPTYSGTGGGGTIPAPGNLRITSP